MSQLQNWTNLLNQAASDGQLNLPGAAVLNFSS